ncbi:phage holin [Aestuariimicrobium soli]|uniref:phage holin n=1 Tax=Aestuariimicrobium soli TaxID=2035834 RepID=UPI003EBDA785
MSAALRSQVYAVAAAVLVILGAYGIVSDARSQQWLGLIDSVLVLVSSVVPLVARRHVPDAPDYTPERGADEG